MEQLFWGAVIYLPDTKAREKGEKPEVLVRPEVHLELAPNAVQLRLATKIDMARFGDKLAQVQVIVRPFDNAPAALLGSVGASPFSVGDYFEQHRPRSLGSCHRQTMQNYSVDLNNVTHDALSMDAQSILMSANTKGDAGQ